MREQNAERSAGAPSAASIRKEAARLTALERLDMLDAPKDEGFERVIRLIKDIFSVEIGIVSLIDAHRQWYQACSGLSNSELPRDGTFCRIVVEEEEAMVVEDAARDARFADHPAVTGPAHIRFYAGMPMKTRDGHTVGTVCAIDRKPKVFTARDLRILEDIAGAVMDRIELLQYAATDGLTGAATRRAFRSEAGKLIAGAVRDHAELAVIVLDIDHFKQINDTRGHAAGDQVLKAIAAACRRVLGPSPLLGRLGGEEFAIVLEGCDQAAASRSAEALRAAIGSERVAVEKAEPGEAIRVTASLGFAGLSAAGEDIDTLLAQADAAMYRAKHDGRNRCVAWSMVRPPRPSSRRRRVVKAGTIILGQGGTALPCTIRTLGEDGAGLLVSDGGSIPDSFRLVVDENGREMRCRVTSRDARRLDVFFDPVS